MKELNYSPDRISKGLQKLQREKALGPILSTLFSIRTGITLSVLSTVCAGVVYSQEIKDFVRALPIPVGSTFVMKDPIPHQSFVADELKILVVDTPLVSKDFDVSQIPKVIFISHLSQSGIGTAFMEAEKLP